jgi:hypothetical protein
MRSITLELSEEGWEILERVMDFEFKRAVRMMSLAGRIEMDLEKDKEYIEGVEVVCAEIVDKLNG